MFRPQPLHRLPSLGISADALQQLRPSCLAAGLLLDAGSAPTKGGQVMFRPRPLHQLPAVTVLAQAPEWCAPAAVRRRPESKMSSSLPVCNLLRHKTAPRAPGAGQESCGTDVRTIKNNVLCERRCNVGRNSTKTGPAPKMMVQRGVGCTAIAL